MRTRALSLTLAFLVAIALAAPVGAVAAKRPSGGQSSLSVYVVSATGDTTVNWGDTISYRVSSPVVKRWVHTLCTVNGAQVFSQTEGFYDGYLWDPYYVLRSSDWMSGAADCTGQLFTTVDGRKITYLASTSFHVSP